MKYIHASEYCNSLNVKLRHTSIIFFITCFQAVIAKDLDEETHQFFINQLNAVDAYISLYQPSPGNWVWRDGTALNWTKWATDTPRPKNIHPDNCVVLYHRMNGDWGDMGCMLVLPFICEMQKKIF